MRWDPITKKYSLHNGIDISEPLGTDVMAVADGVVSEVYSDSSFGNVLKYKTNTGYEVMYAHLSKVFVKVGKHIKSGQVVCKVGNTGYSTGCHLHYTLYKDGALVNPINYVSMPYTVGVVREYLAREDVKNHEN